MAYVIPQSDRIDPKQLAAMGIGGTENAPSSNVDSGGGYGMAVPAAGMAPVASGEAGSAQGTGGGKGYVIPEADRIKDPAMLQYVKEQAGTPAGAAPTPPTAKPESIAPAFWNKMKEGFANVAGLPVHAVAGPLKYFNIIPQDTIAYAGQQWFKNALNVRDQVAIPLDSTGHVSTANQYILQIGEFMGGAMVPGMGLLGKAEKGAEVGVAGAKDLAGAAEAWLANKGGHVAEDTLKETFAKKAEQFGTEEAAKAGIREKVAANVTALRQKDFVQKLYNFGVLQAGAAAAGAGSVEGGQLGQEHYQGIGQVVKGIEQAGVGAAQTAASAVGAKETAAKLAAYGAHIAKDFNFTPEQGSSVGQFLGSFFGPFALTEAGHYFNVGATNAIRNAGNLATKFGMGRTAQRQIVNANVLAKTQQLFNEDPNSMQNLAESLQVMKQVENFKPNLPQITGTAGHIATFKGLADKSPDVHSLATQVDLSNQAALAAFKGKSFGPSTAATPSLAGKGEVGNIFDPARLSQRNLRAVSDLHLKELAQEREALDTAFKVDINPTEVGAGLRELYWNKRTQVKAGLDDMLTGKDGVYATARAVGAKASVADVRKTVQDIVQSDANLFQNMPPVFQRVLREFPEGGKAAPERVQVTPAGAGKPIYRTKATAATPAKDEATFEQVHSLYKQVNREHADAVNAKDFQKAGYLKQLKDTLQGKVQEFSGPEHGLVGQKLQEYNQKYAQYMQIFREGLGGQLAARGRNGVSVDDSEIVKKVILGSGNAKKGVDDFLELYGNDPTAHEFLHNGLLDLYASKAIKNGQFNATAAQTWLDANKKVMDALPDTASYFKNASQIAQDIKFRQAQLQAERKLLDQGVLNRIAKMTNSDKAISRAIAEPDLMKGLLDTAKLHGAEKPLARAVADYVDSQPNPYEFLLKNQGTLKPVMDKLGEKHWDNLMTLATGRKIAGRATAPAELELAQEKDPLHKMTGTTVPGLISIIRNPMNVSTSVNVGAVGSRLLYTMRNADILRAEKAAMFDPDMAQALADALRKNAFVGYGGILLDKADAENLMKLVYFHAINGPVQVMADPITNQSLQSWLDQKEREKRAGVGVGQ